MNLKKIYTWIDKEMEFDQWYKVKNKEQIQVIKHIMDTGLIPDCEFNSDHTQFRKSKLAYETIILNLTQ